MKTTEIENDELLKFVKSCKFHNDVIDELMKHENSKERGKLIAIEMNRFNFDLDYFLHFSLKIELIN